MRVARIGLVAAMLAVAAGCSTFNNMFSKTDPNAPLIPAPQSPVADVPIPAGFEMTKESTSKVVPGNSLRFVDHHYSGSDDMQPVVRFYKDQLPEKGWKFIDQTQPNGKEVSLHYSKSNEDCQVTVTAHAFSTEIHVRIDPAGRNGG